MDAQWVNAAIQVATIEKDDSPPLPTKRITDLKFLDLTVHYHGVAIDQVLLNGGAGNNIMTKAACKRLSLKNWELAPILVWMEDQQEWHNQLGFCKEKF